jgi:hypothetical protein
MERNWFAARFGLGISEVIPHTGAPHIDLHEFEVDVAPRKGDKLRSPQAGAAGEHHHRTFPNVEHDNERSKLPWREYIWFAQPFGRNPYLCDGISVHPLMPDGVIENRRHDVANLAPRTRCVLQGVQPQFHIHSANIRQIERTPLGDDVICQVVRICFDGGIAFSCPPSVRGYGSGLQVH